MQEPKIDKEAIFKIGRVISVEGRNVRVLVNKNKNTSHLIYNGELVKNVTVGGFVKISKGFIKIICKVDGERTDEDKANLSEYSSEKNKINRVLQLSLIGFFNNRGFQRGIKELPLIDNECFLLETDEFESVHNFIKQGDIPIEIGTLSLESNHPIKIGINSLFASHIGIFGNTGSGKSYTLTNIYRQLFVSFIDNEGFRKKSKFYFIDFNGEYVDADVIIKTQYKSTYKLSTRNSNGDKYPVSSESILDTTFWSIILDATEKTQRPFIKRALSSDFFNQITTPEQIKGFIKYLILLVYDKEDKSLMGTIIDFLYEFKDFSNSEEICENLVQRMDFNNKYSEFGCKDDQGNFLLGSNGRSSLEVYLNNLHVNSVEDDFLLIGIRIKLKYFDEIIKGFSNIEHLSPLIKRLEKRIEDLGKVFVIENNHHPKTISIISLKDVNLEMRKMLPLLICKELYDDHKKSDDGYLNIIIDEAHNILSRDSDRESEIWKDYRIETFEEIIKEGRKFGVFLTIASQRPSDISSTVISQLHNFFLHRLINNRDIEAVEKTISYLDRVSFEYLPILPTGTCILAGVLTNMPIIVDINPIDDKQCEPNNKTLNIVEMIKLNA